MTRAIAQPDQPQRVTDLLIRQKCEAMIEYGYVALRQFPKAERHVLAAEMRGSMWARSEVRPGNAVSGILDAQLRQVAVVVPDAVDAFTAGNSLPNFQNACLVKFCAPVARPFRVVADVQEGVVDVFLCGSVAKIFDSVVKVVVVPVSGNNAFVTHPFKALKNKSVRRLEHPFFVDREAEAQVRRCVRGSHREKVGNHPFPVSRLAAARDSGKKRSLLVDDAGSVSRIPVCEWMRSHGNDRAVYMNLHDARYIR